MELLQRRIPRMKWLSIIARKELLPVIMVAEVKRWCVQINSFVANCPANQLSGPFARRCAHVTLLKSPIEYQVDLTHL